MAKIWILVIAFFVSSCGSRWRTVAEMMDTFIFELLGGTLLSEPPEVSVKAIHLEPGQVEGRLIVTEGVVVERGMSDTYLVIFDDNTRLLVNTSKILEERMNRFGISQKRIKILGTVDRGRKGLPMLTALSMSDRRVAEKKSRVGG